MRPDYYRVLDVSPEASSEEIHLAFRARAREHHPDRHADPRAGESGPMALLNDAWRTLGDQSRRRAYDQSRMAPEPPEVQDAILRAVRGLLSGAQDAWGQNGDAAGAESPDLLVVSGSVRASVRLARVLGPEVFDRWLQSAVVAGRRARLDCAVLVACRVLRPDDVALRLRTIRFPAIAIDLIEARSFGAFPCAVSEEMFGTFLR